ncbi:ABC transporter ATP-binding protein [Parasediminibacterium sp. JCM 36343]|uniref:ABC transporter ATP-binding protein n=1 Tax=Parasediminibacterium sp. JCM 36343 TaxID=3374279 RepID=UPI003979F473
MENEKVIEIHGLKKSFNGKEVLKGIDLTLKKGENIVVIGKSGQGKSVTIQCIVGMITPDEGSVKVLGQEIGDLNEEQLKDIRVKVGFLFQHAALYDSMTVRENLAFPLKRVLKIKDAAEIEKRSIEALEAVGLADAIDKMPSDLSGGQRKRMGLARTLIVKPEIILYDEPTTGLDTVTSKEISQLILDIRKKYNASSIIITHDMSCAKMTADRIVVMNDGRYIAEGSYEELEHSSDTFINSFFKLGL